MSRSPARRAVVAALMALVGAGCGPTQRQEASRFPRSDGLLVVAIEADGSILVQGVEVEPDEVASAIRAAAKNLEDPVEFRAERSVLYGDVLEAYALARNAGFENLTIIPEPSAPDADPQ